jgi:hypothetical protein
MEPGPAPSPRIHKQGGATGAWRILGCRWVQQKRNTSKRTVELTGGDFEPFGESAELRRPGGQVPGPGPSAQSGAVSGWPGEAAGGPLNFAAGGPPAIPSLDSSTARRMARIPSPAILSGIRSPEFRVRDSESGIPSPGFRVRDSEWRMARIPSPDSESGAGGPESLAGAAAAGLGHPGRPQTLPGRAYHPGSGSAHCQLEPLNAHNSAQRHLDSDFFSSWTRTLSLAYEPDLSRWAACCRAGPRQPRPPGRLGSSDFHSAGARGPRTWTQTRCQWILHDNPMIGSHRD